MYPHPWQTHSYWPRRDPALRRGERPNYLRILRHERPLAQRTVSPRARNAKPVFVAYQGSR